ncbi:MAG TPA: hypothetical protein VFG83_12510, partial [Kofleriaceae bacterium]|nr:hypothetical protein [Kofleriaceae bacterium]
FSAGDKKLGLGSSAAATVAAIAGALFEKNTRIFRRQNPITKCPTHKRAGIPCQVPDCPRVFALAQKAHARAQEKRGAAGSGADIAAATFGGTLIYERAGNSPRVRPWSPPPGLTLVPVWTQKPAATATLVAAVAAARLAAPAAVAAALEDIAAAAKALIAAATATAAIAAIAAGADAAAHLAEVTGAPLVIPAHHEVAALARAHGGAAKPTGAGGGDIALAALPDAAAAARFRAAAIAAGLPVIAAGIDCGGVALTSCGSTAPGA